MLAPLRHAFYLAAEPQSITAGSPGVNDRQSCMVAHSVRTLNSRHEDDFCFCFAADDVVDVGEGEVIAFPDPLNRSGKKQGAEMPPTQP